MSTEAERFLGIQDDNAPASEEVQLRRKPICNVLALAFPLFVIFLGCIGKPDQWGFGAVIMIIFLFCFAIPVSLLLAIVSLCRRERYVALTIFEIVVYSILVCLMISQVPK